MNRCPVCAQSLNVEEDRCLGCDTEGHSIQAIFEAMEERGFLFANVDGETVETVEFKPAWSSSSRNTKPLEAGGRTKPLADPKIDPRVFAAEEIDQTPVTSDPLLARDLLPEPSPMRRARPAIRQQHLVWQATLLDILLCSGLVSKVFLLIWWLSSRRFYDLVTYSLLPLLFAALTLVGIYFMAFKGLLGRTPGRMLAERLGRA